MKTSFVLGITLVVSFFINIHYAHANDLDTDFGPGAFVGVPRQLNPEPQQYSAPPPVQWGYDPATRSYYPIPAQPAAPPVIAAFDRPTAGFDPFAQAIQAQVPPVIAAFDRPAAAFDPFAVAVPPKKEVTSSCAKRYERCLAKEAGQQVQNQNFGYCMDRFNACLRGD